MRKPGRIIIGCLLACLLISYGQAEAYNNLFRAPVDYAVGANPVDIIAADFDQDGDTDLAVSNFGRVTNVYDSVTILRNNGKGVFQIDTNLITGDGPRAICPGKFAEADFTSNNKSDHSLNINNYPDLAVLNSLTNTVSIFLNNAGMNFEVRPMFYAGQYPSAICAARIRDRTTDDLIIGNSLSAELIVMFNDGYGTFSQSDRKILSNDVRSIKPADLDGDGDLDLIVVTAAVEILINTGAGFFGTPTVYAPGPGYLTDACAADFDGDGDLDIAATNADNKIVRWLNQGDGTFDAPEIFPASVWPRRIAASDLDRDGDIDLVLADNYEGVVMVSINDGRGNFSTEGKYSTGSGDPSAIVVADFDGDNDDDVVSVNSETDDISVFFNKTHTARCVMEPGYIDVLDAYGPVPMTGIIYIGDFDNGYPAGDIDPFSLTINGINPSTVSLVDNFPGIAGEAVRMVFDLDELIRDYGPVWGKESRYFRVLGRFTDETPFAAGGDIVIDGFMAGDANIDRQVNIGDPVYLMNFLYRDGLAPALDAVADANGDSSVDIGDVVYLINYIFKDGLPPCHP